MTDQISSKSQADNFTVGSDKLTESRYQMNCCNEYGDCNQGRNCPIRKTKCNHPMFEANPDQKCHLEKWMIRVAILWTVCLPALIYLMLK